MAMLYEIKGKGPPLVLVPGGLTGWLSWIPIAEKLAQTRTVVRVQLVSVQLGLEDKPLPQGYSLRTEKEALAATVNSIGLKPPVDFAAWSYGGAITLEFLLQHPEWARTLTLIEPGAFFLLPELDEELQKQRDEDLRLSRTDISEDQLEDFVRSSALGIPGVNPRETDQWPVMVKHRQSLRVIPSIWEYKGDYSRLSKFTAPTLLVKGTGSHSSEHMIVDFLGKELPNSQVIELPGGHAPHLVSTQPFLERMAALQAG